MPGKATVGAGQKRGGAYGPASKGSGRRLGVDSGVGRTPGGWGVKGWSAQWRSFCDTANAGGRLPVSQEKREINLTHRILWIRCVSCLRNSGYDLVGECPPHVSKRALGLLLPLWNPIYLQRNIYVGCFPRTEDRLSPWAPSSNSKPGYGFGKKLRVT